MKILSHLLRDNEPPAVCRPGSQVLLLPTVPDLSYESRGFSRIDIDTSGSNPIYSLAGQLMGMPLKSLQGFGVPAESYGFTNKLLAWETAAPLLDRASPLRTAYLRDPVGPQILASAARQSRALDRDCFVAFGPSQLAFRLRYLKTPRDIAVVKAAAEHAEWQTRPSPNPDRNGETLVGRGIAYAQRSGAVVAIVAEVEIDRDTARCGRANSPSPMIAG